MPGSPPSIYLRYLAGALAFIGVKAAVAAPLDWLIAPLDAARPHDIDVFGSWHARFMVLAWSLLFPIGILAARFFKITPRQDWPQVKDNQLWWRLHLLCQWAGTFGALVGLAILYPHVAHVAHVAHVSTTAQLHRIFGWTVLALLAVQIVGGLLRGSKGGPTEPAVDGSWAGDHYDMTARRIIFEYVHKTSGYLALLLSVMSTVLGLWEVNAPRWMWLALSGWCLLLIAVFACLQSRGMARDTYEAIWGPDIKHPGNRMKPVGWGISRASRSREKMRTMTTPSFPAILPLTPLSQSAFAPYGRVLEASARAGYPINQGTTTRTDLGAPDVLAHDGQPWFSLFRARACTLPLPLRLLERHNWGSQTFIPLGGVAFIVVVALGDEAPDLTTLAAFRVDGARGITLARGVWHHPLLSLQDGDFIVLERRGEAPDCDLYDLPQPHRLLQG